MQFELELKIQALLFCVTAVSWNSFSPSSNTNNQWSPGLTFISRMASFLTNVSVSPNPPVRMVSPAVLYLKTKPVQMKNEPVVTYNHMQEDNNSSVANRFNKEEETTNQNHPISLYMIFAVDIFLMCVLGFLAFQLIF